VSVGAISFRSSTHLQSDRVRRLGVMTDTAENNPEGQARVAALRQRLQELGWIEGRNLMVDYRWSEANIERARAYAAEIVAGQAVSGVPAGRQRDHPQEGRHRLGARHIEAHH